MTLEFAVDPELTETLRAQIVACWTDVSNAGGAVGFVPPVTMDDVLPVAEKLFAAVADGRDRLIVGWATDPDSADLDSADPDSAQPRVAALATISDGQFRLTEHWRKVKRVMVHPDFQGRGYGALLMAEIEQTARRIGLEMLTLDCRGGTGNDVFYKKCGYVEYGRLPGALRLSADDYRDQVLMALSLTE
ncbi:GNAT family N-acetyltransferase [Actinocrinis sp.]|uniref:GNAT family N-acetyltransferase n=1 Tax=Actinocrinis sp. TaxID=1920516 RepID=UPI002C9E6BEC|nr:GNAT family N-acetyltransferase [Actinocrinis sp.]HXR73606.1 GNAT family N-acetyltransferase [Actinocrinis sp.]